MFRKLTALIIGFLVSILVGMLSPLIPQFMLPSVGDFVGGLVAGLIARRHGVIYGAVISLGLFFLLAGSLVSIAYKASGGDVFLPQLDLLYPNIFAILFGPIGGYLGEKARKY